MRAFESARTEGRIPRAVGGGVLFPVTLPRWRGVSRVHGWGLDAGGVEERRGVGGRRRVHHGGVILVGASLAYGGHGWARGGVEGGHGRLPHCGNGSTETRLRIFDSHSITFRPT